MSDSGKLVVQVIKDKDLHKVTTDIVEKVMDTAMDDGLLKDIPVLSTLIGVGKVVSTVQDRLFAKKLLTFLYELHTVSEDQRVEQIIKLEDDEKYSTKVGEKILHIIDKCDDLDKSRLVGRLFKAYLESHISYDDFLSCVSSIERTPLPELLAFIKDKSDGLDTEGEGSSFVSYGLMEIRFQAPKVKIKRESPYDYQDKYAPSEEEILESKIEITDAKALCYVNYIGNLLREHLR